jgi:hypothetical protein
MAIAKRPNARPAILAGLIFAATLTASSAAFADDWCGYATKDTAVVQCGYTTVSQCEDAVGKGGMCFVDPDVALNKRNVLHTPIPKASHG